MLKKEKTWENSRKRKWDNYPYEISLIFKTFLTPSLTNSETQKTSI
jgi:hypothetical protein